MAIPVVNLADFLSGDENKKNSFVQSLGKAYEDVGFVAVKNHGITDELISDLYKYVQQFFSLPLDKKEFMKSPNSPDKEAIHRLEKNMQKEVKLPI